MTSRPASRSRLAESALASLIAAAAAALITSAPACSRREPGPRGPGVFGVALHVHGSHSEGAASMRAHTQAAAALGGAVDVIWWTDHDWRIAGHTYVDAFDFEHGLMETELVPRALRMPELDGREPLPGWASGADSASPPAQDSLEPVQKGFAVRHVPGTGTRVRMEVSEREARQGVRSLHVDLAGPPAGRDRLVLGFEATRRRHIASLASGVTLRLSLLPAQLAGDARLIVSAGLSQSAPGERSRLDYVLAADDAEARRAPSVEQRPLGEPGGIVRVATLPIAAEPGRWNDLVLEPSRDAEAHGLGGADNSLVDLSLSLEVGGGARLELYVDALAIERARLGEPLFEGEREQAAELTTDALVQHVGQEISYAAHLTAYGASVPLADLARHPHGLGPEEAAEWAHRHGGLVSLAHVFGTDFESLSYRFPRSREAFEATLARTLERRAFGVDLLEVGYRSRGHELAAFVELWDRLAAGGVRLVGVGVSDSHDAEVGWTSGPNNFITWIHADSAAEADLLAGLRAGRAFFGDPTRFDGVLDIEAERGGRMGELVTRPPGRERVRFVARGLRSGQTLRVVQDGRELAVHEPTGADFEVVRELEITGPSGVRFEVWEAGEAVVLSNPLWFAPAE